MEFGGNTGTVNSFTGLNVGDLTGGVYNAQTLLKGNNAACFAFQAAQQAVPTVASALVSDVTAVVALVNKYVSPVLQALNCPALNTWDDSQFDQFPGASYHPTSSKRR